MLIRKCWFFDVIFVLFVIRANGLSWDVLIECCYPLLFSSIFHKTCQWKGLWILWVPILFCFVADIFISSPNLLRANFAQSGKLMTRLVINKRICITMTWQWTWLPHEVNDSIMQNTNNVGQHCNTIHCRYHTIGFFWVKFPVAR